MSMAATLLDELGLPAHPSFLGQSIYQPGREAVVVESAGRGSCDLQHRDLCFTIVTEDHKLMVRLKDSNLRPERFYDLNKDPFELDNIVDTPSVKPVMDALLRHLVERRADILTMRGVNLEKYYAKQETA
jgi:arylsulfatase A-like enzyme